MRILVTGASGAVGLGVVKALKRHGHEVLGLFRTPSNEALVRQAGAEPLCRNLNDPAVYDVAGTVDGIVHAAQGDFYNKRISPSVIAQSRNDELTWTRRLLEAGKGRARVFVYTSGCWVYGDTGEEWVDENSSTRPYRAGTYKLEGEALALEEGKKLGYESVVALRLGTVYGGAGSFGKFVLDPMKQGKSAKWIGSGKQFVSNVHVEDVGEAAALVFEKRPGFTVLNVVDDEPARISESHAFLAKELKAKPPGGAPTLIVKLVAGLIAEPLSSSQRVRNARAKKVLGWSPKFPSYREGYLEVAKRAQNR